MRWEPAIPDEEELARNPLSRMYPNGGRSILKKLPMPEDQLQPMEFVDGSAAEFTKFLSYFENEFPKTTPSFSIMNLGWQLFSEKMPKTDSVRDYLKIHPYEYKVRHFENDQNLVL